MFSRTIHKAVTSVEFGITAVIDSFVDEGPRYAVLTSNPDGLDFRVYDSKDIEVLGSITSREVARWTDELNGKGSGMLTVRLDDPAILANPHILDDDNIVRALYRGNEVFAWRVKTGQDVLVSESEKEGETAELSGPGLLDALEEAIVRPEYPLSGDPTRENDERYFGYMSKAPTTTRTDSQPPIYNYNTKPKVTAATDWTVTAGGTRGTKTMGTNQGHEQTYESIRFTYTTTGSTQVAIKQAFAATIPNYRGSIGVWVRSSLGGTVYLKAYNNANVYTSDAYTLEPGEYTYIVNEAFAVGSPTAVYAEVLLDGDMNVSGNIIDISCPMASKFDEVPEYFDGDTQSSQIAGYAWVGGANGSYSTYTAYMELDDNRQPSWYNQYAWTKKNVAVRKSVAAKTIKKSGLPFSTGVNSPEGWQDPTAYLIWPTSPMLPSAPGTVYWRNEFYVTATSSVFVQAAADNKMELWLDGVKIIETGDNGDATDILGSWEGTLSPGTHLIAASTTNYNGTDVGNNFGWFLATVMYKVNNKPVGVITHTDSSWYAFKEGDTNVPHQDTYKAQSAKTTTTSKKVSVTYTVRSGDTLTAIGRKFGIDWHLIYNANKKAIDARAAKSGLANKGPGWWIFPGQKLTIPGQYKTTSVTPKPTSTKKVLASQKWTAGEALTTEQPGWYPYQVLARLVREGKDRNVRDFQNITLGFEAGNDSEGVPWPVGFDAIVNRSFRIGDSVYDAAQDLVDGGMDVRMSPSFVLNAYTFMGEYKGISAAFTEQFHLMDKGASTLTYVVKKRNDLKNALLIDTDLGWRDFTLVGDEEGRSEASASLGGINADKIVSAVGAELNELAIRTKTVTTTFVIRPGRVPYVDFDLGDIVVAVDSRWKKFDARITSIGVSERSDNFIVCEIEASGEGLA